MWQLVLQEGSDECWASQSVKCELLTGQFQKVRKICLGCLFLLISGTPVRRPSEMWGTPLPTWAQGWTESQEILLLPLWDSTLSPPHWWCPNKVRAPVVLRMWWWSSLLFRCICESKWTSEDSHWWKGVSFCYSQQSFPLYKSSVCQISQIFLLAVPAQLFSHSDCWSWLSDVQVSLYLHFIHANASWKQFTYS